MAMKTDKRMQSIRMILSDVDGVLTDGAITYDNQGIETKTFHVRDGMGIQLWQRAGHRFGILTARTSHIVKVRMAEIGVEIVRQGIEDKFIAAKSIIEQQGMSFEEVCYIGDDLKDLRLIKSVGLGVSVADAAADVRKAADLVTTLAGGKGAVRELIETILQQQKRWEELIGNFD